MTGFEKNLKDSLLDFQPNISGKENSWNNIQKALKAKRRAKYFYGIAASAIIVASTFALWPTNNAINLPEPFVKPDTSSVVEPKIRISTETHENIADEAVTKSVFLETESPEIAETELENNLIVADSSENEELLIKEAKPNKEHTDKINFFAEVTVNNARVCPGEKIQFHLNTKEPVMVEWIFSNGVKSEELNPSFKANKAGKYAASVKLTSMVTGKEKTIYLEDGFQIFPKNNYSINVEEIHGDNFERKYHLNIEGDNVTSVNWIGVEKTSNILKVELNERGNYQYTAEVFDVNGCKTVLNTNFDVETDNNLLAPTAFTPNGDNVNDEFLPDRKSVV